ncbi:hypothetical protein [Terriglobus albidus]|uniref:hypothetical protein n=1 Tax=Terriglobus albidus TaxID=1592106 RepID=UPI0021DFD272|nr:hypothetical protein [Terriglobus albidus]
MRRKEVTTVPLASQANAETSNPTPDMVWDRIAELERQIDILPAGHPSIADLLEEIAQFLESLDDIEPWNPFELT